MVRSTLRFLGLAVVSVFAVGCATTLADVCDAVCDCEEDACSDRALDECEREAHRIESAAEELGCAGQLDAYVECVDAKLECTNKTVSTAACSAEEKALDDCLDQEQG